MIRSKIAMGFLWALFALALHVWPMVPGARAQGSRKDDIVFNSRGVPLAGATVRVCAMPASGQPCTPLAQIFSDAALTQALANPTTTDGLGNYFFYAAPGKYEIEFSGPAITTKQIPNVILPSDPTSPTQLNGCQYVNANQSFAVALAAAGASGCIQVTPGTYTVSANATVPTGVGLAFSKGGVLSGTSPTTLTVNSPIYASPDAAIFGGTLVIQLGGANAVVSSAWWGTGDIGTDINRGLLGLQNGGGNAGGWVDARHYTASQTSSTNAFAGITIPFTLYLPCTSITLSVPWIHQGSQQFVEGCVNGNPAEIIASSSWPQITLTSQSQTGTTVTGTTSTAHGFSPHQLVCISGTTDKPTEGCVFLVTASGTTFTWTNNFSSTRSSTGGIVGPPLVGVGTDSSGALSRVRWTRVNFNANGKAGTVFANVGGEEGSGLDTWVSTNFVGYGIFQCGSAAIVNFSNFPSNNKYSTGHVLYNSGSNNTTGFSAFECGTGGRVTLENTTLATNGSAGTGNTNIYVSGSNVLLAGNHIESAATGINIDRNSIVVISDLGVNSSVTNTVVSDAAGNVIDADVIPSGSSNAIINNCPGGHTLTGTIVHYRASSNCQETWVKDDATKTLNVNGTLRGALSISDQGTSCANGNLALSAGWGSTATVTGAAGTGQTCQFTLTSAGTGQAVNATITDTLPTALPTANTVCTAQLTGGTGMAALSGAGLFINQTTLSATAPAFTFPGLPAAGSTYFVVIKCGP
jgi:hypothetical protein